MSKKKKRKTSSAAGSPAAKSVVNVVSNEFNPDYTDIKRELKRIGILAGSFLGLLVILSFFQNQILSIFVK
ncbi:MAG: hypothetical protein ACK2TS_03530 [Anaerolineales bacterium]|jgi:hypothetical protein